MSVFPSGTVIMHKEMMVFFELCSFYTVCFPLAPGNTVAACFFFGMHSIPVGDQIQPISISLLCRGGPRPWGHSLDLRGQGGEKTMQEQQTVLVVESENASVRGPLFWIVGGAWY